MYNAINNIEKIQHSREFIFGEAKKEYNMGIDFICFTNEPQAMKELKAKILDFAKTLSSDEYIKIK